jgi:putative holliday junction resolvase
LRQGVRLAVDPGSVRIGVARSDRSGIIATPMTVVRRGRGDLDALASLAAAEEAIEILVGLPRSLTGQEGAAAATARRFATVLASRVAPLPVRLVDERFTTATAHAALRASGHDSRARRQSVDSAAAAVLLEAALEAERRTGTVPGELVHVGEQHERRLPPRVRQRRGVGSRRVPRARQRPHGVRRRLGLRRPPSWRRLRRAA